METDEEANRQRSLNFEKAAKQFNVAGGNESGLSTFYIKEEGISGHEVNEDFVYIKQEPESLKDTDYMCNNQTSPMEEDETNCDADDDPLHVDTGFVRIKEEPESPARDDFGDENEEEEKSLQLESDAQCNASTNPEHFRLPDLISESPPSDNPERADQNRDSEKAEASTSREHLRGINFTADGWSEGPDDVTDSAMGNNMNRGVDSIEDETPGRSDEWKVFGADWSQDSGKQHNFYARGWSEAVSDSCREGSCEVSEDTGLPDSAGNIEQTNDVCQEIKKNDPYSITRKYLAMATDDIEQSIPTSCGIRKNSPYSIKRKNLASPANTSEWSNDKSLEVEINSSHSITGKHLSSLADKFNQINTTRPDMHKNSPYPITETHSAPSADDIEQSNAPSEEIKKDTPTEKHTVSSPSDNDMSGEIGKLLLRCFECGDLFANEADLAAHLRAHAGDEPFVCEICDRSFGAKASLANHMRKHIKKVPIPLYSPYFTGQAPSVHPLLTGGAPLMHPYLAGGAPTLMVPMVVAGVEKPHKCPECGMGFSAPSRLTYHIRTHTGEKPYECTECGKKFARQETLTDHMRAHTGEKPYQCPHCERSFGRASILHRHLTTHASEKPHECTECSKRFRLKAHLKLHMRTHTGERPYKCTECSKGFSRQSGLIVHMRKHTGEKPFPCPYCERCLSSKLNLKKHMETHSGRQTEIDT